MIQIERWEGAKRLMPLGAFLSFFGILYYIAPIGIYPDSGSYISMQEGREPLYPLFLAFFGLSSKKLIRLYGWPLRGSLRVKRQWS